MANLTARSAFIHAPLTIGTVTLRAAPQTPIWAIMPYDDALSAVSAALDAAHGISFPEPGHITRSGDAHAVWAGRTQAFLFGVDPAPDVAAHAAVVDQSDGWAHLILEGADAEQVLARLIPVDVSLGAFPVGHAARSSIGHMAGLILREGAVYFEILVFRSMVDTAHHDLTRAMRHVAARTVAMAGHTPH